MKFVGDYHTHTLASDGTGFVRDNLRYAEKRGLEEVAITDHSFTCFLCHMTRWKFNLQEKAIKKYLDRTKSTLKVYHGVEGNLLGFDGYLDVPDDVIKRCDVLHLGFHRYLKIHVAFKYAKYSSEISFVTVIPCAIFVKKELTYTLSPSWSKSGISSSVVIPDIIASISNVVSVIWTGFDESISSSVFKM